MRRSWWTCGLPISRSHPQRSVSHPVVMMEATSPDHLETRMTSPTERAADQAVHVQLVLDHRRNERSQRRGTNTDLLDLDHNRR